MAMKKLLAAGALSTMLLLGACGESDETDVTEPEATLEHPRRAGC